MSSQYVRDQVKAHLTASFPLEKIVDLTGEFEDLEIFLASKGVSFSDNWIGLQFIGNEEIPINVGANNTDGCYRETGIILIHIVYMAALGAGTSIIQKGDLVRAAMRGIRLGDIIIESAGPINLETGTTLDFEGGYVSGTISIGYYRDLNL